MRGGRSGYPVIQWKTEGTHQEITQLLEQKKMTPDNRPTPTMPLELSPTRWHVARDQRSQAQQRHTRCNNGTAAVFGPVWAKTPVVFAYVHQERHCNSPHKLCRIGRQAPPMRTPASLRRAYTSPCDVPHMPKTSRECSTLPRAAKRTDLAHGKPSVPRCLTTFKPKPCRPLYMQTAASSTSASSPHQ